jgi:hypothetical protein
MTRHVQSGHTGLRVPVKEEGHSDLRSPQAEHFVAIYRSKQSPIHQISSGDDFGVGQRSLHVGIGQDLVGPVIGLKRPSISQEKNFHEHGTSFLTIQYFSEHLQIVCLLERAHGHTPPRKQGNRGFSNHQTRRKNCEN